MRISQDSIKAIALKLPLKSHLVVITIGCQKKMQCGKTHQITLTPLFCIPSHWPCLCPDMCSGTTKEEEGVKEEHH